MNDIRVRVLVDNTEAEKRSTRRKSEVLGGKAKYSEEKRSTLRKSEVLGGKTKYSEEKRSTRRATSPTATLRCSAGDERLETDRLIHTANSDHVGIGRASRYMRIWTLSTSMCNKQWLRIACYHHPFVSLLLPWVSSVATSYYSVWRKRSLRTSTPWQSRRYVRARVSDASQKTVIFISFSAVFLPLLSSSCVCRHSSLNRFWILIKEVSRHELFPCPHLFSFKFRVSSFSLPERVTSGLMKLTHRDALVEAPSQTNLAKGGCTQ